MGAIARGHKMGKKQWNSVKNMVKTTNFFQLVTLFLRAKEQKYNRSRSLFKESDFEQKSKERKSELPTLKKICWDNSHNTAFRGFTLLRGFKSPQVLFK